MSKIKLFDLHSDLPTSSLKNKLSLAKQNVENGNLCINAVYRGKLKSDKAFALARDFFNQGCLLAFEDCCYQDFFIDAEKNINCDKVRALVIKLSTFSPLYLSLGWNYENCFCGGCASSAPLTAHGEIFIEQSNACNIAVDLAHTNEKSFYQILNKANKVLCSHTAFQWVYPHRRNLDKNQVRAVLDKGGIIGVIAVGHFLSGIKSNNKNYKNAYFEHIKSYLKNFGVNGLCIGSDFYGSDAPVYADGDYGFVQEVHDFFKNIGFSHQDCEKVLYKNAVNFFNF